jgi:hypothetical protein
MKKKVIRSIKILYKKVNIMKKKEFLFKKKNKCKKSIKMKRQIKTKNRKRREEELFKTHSSERDMELNDI